MIRVGVVGLGMIAPAHLEAYLSFPERCQVVALADTTRERCAEIAGRYGLEAEFFKDHMELLEKADVDLVSICTPPLAHAEIAADVLESGSNVLVEKPMATSLADCDAMLAAQAKGGGLLSVVANNRFRTSMARLHHLLGSGAPGRVLHVQAESYWWRGSAYYDKWWRGRWETEGGGCTFTHAVHQVDLILWTMGAPEEVRALIGNVGHGNSQVEDVSAALFRFPQGAFGQLASSVVHHGEGQRLVFQTERARLGDPFDCYASHQLPDGFPERDRAVEAELTALYESVPPLQHEGHTGQVENVLTSLEGGGEPLVDGNAGRRAVELITAIYKSSITGLPVTLPLPVTDPLYRHDGLVEAAPRFQHKKEAP